jgi:hypothetical protein
MLLVAFRCMRTGFNRWVCHNTVLQRQCVLGAPSRCCSPCLRCDDKQRCHYDATRCRLPIVDLYLLWPHPCATLSCKVVNLLMRLQLWVTHSRPMAKQLMKLS